MSPVRIGAVNAVGRDLIALPAHQNRHRAVLQSRVHRARKQGLDLLGARIRRDIPVVRLFSQYAVPHTAADRIGLMARRLQFPQNFSHRLRQVHAHHSPFSAAKSK